METKEQLLHHHTVGIYVEDCKRCLVERAAPELLEACEAMAARLETLTTGEFALSVDAPEREQLYAAIKKARGDK